MNWNELSDAEFAQKEAELTRDARLSYGSQKPTMSDADAAKIEAELREADKKRAEDDGFRTAMVNRSSGASLYDELRANDQQQERARLEQLVRRRAREAGVRVVEDFEPIREILFNATSRLSEEARINRAINLMREMGSKLGG